MTTDTPHHGPVPGSDDSINWRLWFGLVAGPVAWSLHLLASYGFASAFACELGWTWLLHTMTVLTAVLAIAGAVVAWRAWNGRDESAESTLHGYGTRQGFMVVLGITLSILTLAGIAFNAAPTFVIGVCA